MSLQAAASSANVARDIKAVRVMAELLYCKTRTITIYFTIPRRMLQGSTTYQTTLVTMILPGSRSSRTTRCGFVGEFGLALVARSLSETGAGQRATNEVGLLRSYCQQ
jgi:hypothetical protein